MTGYLKAIGGKRVTEWFLWWLKVLCFVSMVIMYLPLTSIQKNIQHWMEILKTDNEYGLAI